MKRFLLALACLAFGFEAYAANPSFSSFATNQFITNNFLIRSRLNPFQFDTNASSVTITNLGSLAGTNNFNTIVVSNLYTTNFFYATNIVTYITNLYVTNIVVDNITIITNGTIAGTNIASMADLVWTNELGNIRPTGLQNSVTATNIIGNERLTAGGAFILQALLDYVLDPGLNDISAFTNSVIWIEGFDSDPANSSLRLNMGNGQGHILVIQNNANNSGFTMRNGEPLFASPPGAVQRLNGDWVTSSKGDALMLYNNGQGWSEIGRMAGSTNNLGSGLWESVGGVLRPLAFSSGTNQFTIAQSTGWSGTGTNAFMDDGTFAGVAMINPTDGAIPYRVNAYEFGDVAAGTGFLHNDGANSFSWQSVGADLWTNNAGVLQPNDFTLQPVIENTLVVGTNTIGIYGAPNGESLVSIRDVSTGESDYNSIFMRVINGANSSKIVMDLGSAGGTQMLQEKTTVAGTRSLNVANGSSMRIIGADGITGQNLFRLDPDITDNTAAYQLNTALTHTLGDLLEVQNNGTNQFVVGLDGSADKPFFQLLKSNGEYFQVEMSLGGPPVIDSSSSSIYFTPALVMFSSIVPAGGYNIDVGQLTASGEQMRNVVSTNFYAMGGLWFTPNGEAGLKVSHSGTNGVAIYDSQASGIAGDPRPHSFQLGATNQFVIGDGWVQLARGITKAQKAAITPTNGMIVYQTDNTPGLRAYVNGSWVIISTAADP